MTRWTFLPAKRPLRTLWCLAVMVAAVYFSGWLALAWIGLFTFDIEVSP